MNGFYIKFPFLQLTFFTLINSIISINSLEIYDNESYKIIETESGLVRGLKNLTFFEEKAYYAFKGIPYAKPPLNGLRFKPPQKVNPWSDVFNAFEWGNECIQPVIVNSDWKGQEDCLFINVFVPANTSGPDDKMAVMFYIHGGGYYLGSGNMYGPDFLLNKNVIVVSFNYRLGPFGFLSLGNPDYSGNMGLKDQLLALKWVQQNIESFGGDKNKVTIFGHSAGSSSVNLHVLSPASQGLFHHAIMSSGSVLNPWSHTEKHHLSMLYSFAANIFYPVNNNRDLIDLLKIVDAKLLARKTAQDFYVSGLGRKVAELIWAPVVEHPHTINPFMARTPLDILLDENYSSDVDTMFGYTTAEMLIIMLSDLANPDNLKTFDERFEIQLPLKNAKINFNSKEYKLIADKIRTHYFGKNGRVNNETLSKMCAMMSDIWFTYGIDLTARMQANSSLANTYFYVFSVEGRLNIFKKFSTAPLLGLNGSSHGDDILYLFRLNGPIFLPSSLYTDLEVDSMERKTINYMTKLWTNFAKYGNPTLNNDPIEWKPIKGNELNYIDITNDGLIAKQEPKSDTVAFWNDIFKEHHKLWQPKHKFSFNVLAVKIPLAVLAGFILTIIISKIIGVYVRRKKNNNKITTQS